MAESPLSTWQAAERFAADFLKSAGFSDARTTGGGTDGGVDVRGTGVLAQVKHHAKPVGRPDLQRLYGARGTDAHALYFFGLSGFSPQAIAYAREHNIGLLRYDGFRNVTAVTPAAFTVAKTVREREARAEALQAKAAQAKADWAGTRFEIVYVVMFVLAGLGIVLTVLGIANDEARAAAGVGVGLIVGAIVCFAYLFVAGGTVDDPND